MDSEERSAGPGASLLLVIGEPFSEDHKTQILDQITKGFRCWDSEESGININEELANIASKAALGEEGVNGERTIQHVSENLAVDILINPVTQSVKNSLKKLLVAPSAVKYVIHAGHAFQDNGAWVLQDDTFEFHHLAQVFKNIDVENGLKQNFEASLTIHTVAENNWGKSISKADFTNSIRIQLNPPQKQEDMHGILQFTAYVGSFIKVVPLTSLLQASEQFGNISFTRPTLYIFPGCEGDSALFGVNGFNLLVNGGYNRRACFWDFARHLDRVDAMLLTHLGSDNIFSMNTVLQRKNLDNIHPQIGYLYCNVPEKLLQTLVETDTEKEGEKDPSLLINLSTEGTKLVTMAKRAGIAPHSCLRDDKAKTVDPINLYHKLGHGSLDMYALNPTSDSKELKEFYQQWTKQGTSLGTNGPFPSQNALSVCTLLVWKPYNLNDKIVRVLFPGNAPQHKIAEGLEKIKTFDFLKHASCTGRDLLKPVAVKKTRPSSGAASSRATSKTTTSRLDSKAKTDPRSARTDTKSSMSSPTKTMRSSKERDDLTKRLSKPKEVKPPRPSSAASSSSSMTKSSATARKATSPRKSLSPSKSPSPPKTSPAKTPSTPAKPTPKSPAKSPSPAKVASPKEQTPEPAKTEKSPEPAKTDQTPVPAKTEQTPDLVLAPAQPEESTKTSNGLIDSVEEIPAAVPEPTFNNTDQGGQKHEADQSEPFHSMNNGTTEPKEAWVMEGDQGSRVSTNMDPKAGMFGNNGNMMDNDDEEIKPQALPDPPIVDMGYHKEETFQPAEAKQNNNDVFDDHSNSAKIDPPSSFVFSNDDDYTSDRVALEQNIQYGISNGSAKRAMGGIQEVDEEENEDGLSSSYGGDGFERNYSASEEINMYKNIDNPSISSFEENNGDGDMIQKDETESLEKYTKPSDAEDQTFDPLAQWGQPLGLPAPSLPDSRRSVTSPTKSRTGTDSRTSRMSTTSSRTTTTTSKSSSTRPSSGAASARRGASSRSSPPASKIPPLPPVTPFYVDLTYIPTHGDALYCDIEFFKRVRARYYVLSSLAPNPKVLDCLMQGKATWEQDDLEVTIIPTYDNETLRHWIGLNKEKLQELHIDMTPAVSRCTIQLQDLETSLPAYRLEV